MEQKCEKFAKAMLANDLKNKQTNKNQFYFSRLIFILSICATEDL